MINRADILSRQFELPQPVGQPAATRASAPAGPTMNSEYFGIPKAAEGLQWTDNTAELANRYYQRLAGIDQFAKSMWLNNKIDVTKPDYSNPQSIAASQAYQQELGNIMAIADELKQGSKALEAANAQAMTGNYMVNPEATAVQGKGFASFTPAQRGQFTGLTEPFQESVKQFSGGRETSGIMQQEQAQFDARMKQYEDYANQIAAINPEEANYILNQVQRARLAQNQYLNPPAAPSGYGTGTTFGLINNANVLGGGDSFYTPTKQLDENGKPILTNQTNDFIGIPLGGGFVTELKRANNKTFLVNDKGYEEEVRPDNIYKYLVMAAKKTGQEKELEIEFKKLVDQGKVKWDKTNLTYTPVGLTVDELMSDLGKTERKRLEQSLPDYKEQVTAAKTDLTNKLTQIKEFNKKGFWNRADTGLFGWFGEDVPKTIIPTNSPLKQVEISPAPYSKAEEDFIQVKLIDNSGTQLSHIPKGGKEAIPGLFKFKDINEALSFLQKEFGVFDVGALIQELPSGQQPTQAPQQEEADDIIEQDGNLFKKNKQTGEYEFFRKK